MKLQHLFFYDSATSRLDPEQLAAALELEVTGLFFDARKVIKQSIFFAIKGIQSDGHDYISEAIKNGAGALVVEDISKVPDTFQGLVYCVASARQALDRLAARFYHDPSQRLFCFGVTGTNGKTSITYILEHILNTHHKMTGVMGTVNHRVGETIWESQMTTPDPVTLQSRLQDFLKHKAFAAAMEVSSHALDQQRANSVHFNTVIFTNLTLDHLDYHKDMQSYFQAKQKLFTDLMWSSSKRPLFAIINTDDSYGRRFKVAETAIIWTYGQKDADFQFKILRTSLEGMTFELKTPVETKIFKTALVGIHNVYNLVACIAAALTCGVTLEQSAKAIETFKGIPGRLQKVDGESRKVVFVDYAHTPDALQNTLTAIQNIKLEAQSKGKIITVFGCGGDRDKSKRPKMAEIACHKSDFVFVTSDNPRNENPQVIIDEIKIGIASDYKSYAIELDRETAIKKAIAMATDEDVILIAGKGHEDYQIIGEEKKYFSDVVVAKKYL